MRTRHLLVMTALAAVAAPLPAHAAVRPKPKPKPVPPVCNLVTDPKDDAGLPGTSSATTATNDTNNDIVSADVATDAKNITVVVRVQKITDPAQWSPAGRRWTLSFTVGNDTVGFTTTAGPLATNYAQGTTVGVIDKVKSEIRVTMPLSSVAAVKIVKGTKLQNFSVRASSAVGLRREDGLGEGPQAYIVDSASSTRTYIAGTPSCVKIGQ